ncbi:MAG: dihydrolipoyl dehydrogenase [Saprospiraceae bacterium]|jgi:dihydrolipoamide dehydrogenase|nr:dihydrolipoyl dehydrogenase [Saprospiraceae bacterium]
MKYDVTVIGSGPGGYVAAIRCAQLGMKTAIIEKESTLGGTCLNVGCIPSKALLDSSEHFHNAQKTFAEHGVMLDNLAVDMNQMIDRKAKVVDENVKGIDFLMKKNKIDVINGFGSFKDANTILVTAADGTVTEISTTKAIIATGSVPNIPASFNFDGKRIISSTEALEIREVPKRMIVVGGGVIGMELGSVFGRLGTEIEVVEYMERIIPTMDKDCGKQLQRSLKGLGFKFHLKHMVNEVQPTENGVKVIVQKRDSEDTFEIEADYCLVSIGRKPFTSNLGLENIGVKLDERGRVEVNGHLETSAPGVYAIGDVVKGAMLAHKAEEEGVFVAEKIAGQKPHINYNLIPGVVYTWPEVSAVGATEQELKDAKVPYKAGKFPFKALGRARASMDTDGMVKVLAHKETDEILGVHMVGARTADMIAEAVAVMEFRGSAEDVARMSHAHPTYTEAFKEAALAATGDRALHM